MTHTRESETETEVTGTTDKDYNLFRYIENCLETAARMETYRRDAERADDTALAALFTMAQKDNRKGAEIGKKLLASRLRVDDGEPVTSRAETAAEEHVAPDAAVEQPPVDVMAPSRNLEG